MTYHHDNELSGHHAAGRRTAGAILDHSDRQNFDVTITAAAVFGDFYEKRINAFIAMSNGSPTLVVEHPLDNLYPPFRKVIPVSMNSGEIHEMASRIAREQYREYISGILLSKGFRERD